MELGSLNSDLQYPTRMSRYLDPHWSCFCKSNSCVNVASVTQLSSPSPEYCLQNNLYCITKIDFSNIKLAILVQNLKTRIYFLKLTNLKAAASCVPVIKISFSLISPINSLLSYIQLGSTRRHLDSVTGSYIPFGSFSKFENLDGCLWWFRCDEDVSSTIWTQYSNAHLPTYLFRHHATIITRY